MIQPNILLVDDKEENLISLEFILEDVDANLLKAGSGAEAIDLALQNELALVLLDVAMPEMDGFETARQIQLNKDVPIIFLTAYAQAEEYVLKGYASGAIDYLPKPFQPDILLSKVNTFLTIYRQRRLLTEKTAQLVRDNWQLQASGEKNSAAMVSLVGGLVASLQKRDHAGFIFEYGADIFIDEIATEQLHLHKTDKTETDLPALLGGMPLKLTGYTKQSLESHLPDPLLKSWAEKASVLGQVTGTVFQCESEKYVAYRFGIPDDNAPEVLGVNIVFGDAKDTV